MYFIARAVYFIHGPPVLRILVAIHARVATAAHLAAVKLRLATVAPSAVCLAVVIGVGVALAAAEKEKSWSGLMISKKKKSRGAGS